MLKVLYYFNNFQTAGTMMYFVYISQLGIFETQAYIPNKQTKTLKR